MNIQVLINYLKSKKRLAGFASYSMVLLIALISVLIVSVIQNRLLLSIYRRQSLSDTLINEYSAESEIYDIFTRIIGYGATFPVDYTQPLPDGTQLTVDTEEDPVTGDQAVTVTARRPYAVTVLRGDRTLAVTGTDRVDIILSIDCSGSMGELSGTVDVFGNPTTRFEEAERAALALVQAIKDHPDSAKFYLGVEIFGIDAAWIKEDPLDATSADITPTNNHTLVENAIEASFGHDIDDSPVCKLVLNNTSIGSGFALARDYFNANPIPPSLNVKRAEILITDGNPNSRMPYADCPGPDTEPDHFGGNFFCPTFRYFCPGKFYANTKGWLCDASYMSGPSSCLLKTMTSQDPPQFCDDTISSCIIDCGECHAYSRDFVRCTLARSGATYPIEPTSGIQYSSGVRDPSVAAYVVTIYDPVSDIMHDIFSIYADKYFELGDAANLKTVLEDIFIEISSTASFKLQRIVPSPLP